MRIDNLTPDQIARFPEYVERWTQIGLSTEPADRPAAEAAIREMYQCAGLKPPRKIVWCGSPLSQGLVRTIILDRRSVGASVRDSVGDSVWASVGASVRDSVRDSVGDSVRDSVWDSVYGAHDAGWLAFYAYFREVCGLAGQTEKLAGMTALAQSAGWALPHENICWVSERHHVLERDDRGRLHNIAGPAVAYPDGWTIYAVNGVRVPEKWIVERDTLGPAEILSATNVEQRAAGASIIGWPKMLSALNAKTIDSDPNPAHGELIEVTLPGLPEPGRFLKAECPRNGTICEGVPREIKTVLQAQAWRVGLAPDEFSYPEIRT